MKISKKIKPILYSVGNMILVSFIRQDDLGFTFSTVLAFIVGTFVFPPLFTFMSDQKKDTYYK